MSISHGILRINAQSLSIKLRLSSDVHEAQWLILHGSGGARATQNSLESQGNSFSSQCSLTLQRCSCNAKISACESKRLDSFSEGSFSLCTELILVGEAVNIGTWLLEWLGWINLSSKLLLCWCQIWLRNEDLCLPWENS